MNLSLDNPLTLQAIYNFNLLENVMRDKNENKIRNKVSKLHAKRGGALTLEHKVKIDIDCNKKCRIYIKN